jgi:hypothetical protein
LIKYQPYTPKLKRLAPPGILKQKSIGFATGAHTSRFAQRGHNHKKIHY